MARTVMERNWTLHVRNATSNLLDAVSADIVSDTDRMAPRGETRRLHRSYGTVRAAKLKRRIGSSLKYATVVELGGPPHVIRAKRGKALRWVDDEGRVHFARKVNHPGQLAQPHLRLALYTRRTYARSFE